MNIKNWIVTGLMTAAAAGVTTLGSIAEADCTNSLAAGTFFGSTSCTAPSGARGTAQGSANNPNPRTLTAFLDAVGPNDTKARAEGRKSTGVLGCSVIDSVVGGGGVLTGCSAANSVTLSLTVF